MTATLTEQHYLIRHAFPGTYGDRPTPWEVTYTCGCGAELWEETEGYGSTPGTPGDALDDHLTALCDCGADLTEEACPNTPDACLDCCGENHR